MSLSIDLELDATVHTHMFTHETRMTLPIFEYDFTSSLWISMVDHCNLYGKTVLISPVIHDTAYNYGLCNPGQSCAILCNPGLNESCWPKETRMLKVVG